MSFEKVFAQAGREWVVLPGAPSYPQICLDPEEETRFLEQHAPVVSIKKSAASSTGNRIRHKIIPYHHST